MKLLTINNGVTIAADQQAPSAFTIPYQAVDATKIAPATVAKASGSLIVVGQLSDVTNGYASYTSIQSALTYLQQNSLTGKIMVLPGTYTESLTFSSNEVFVEGCGHSTYLNGSITFASNYCMVKHFRHQNVTFNAATDGNRVSDTWATSGSTVTNNGGAGNYWNITGE